MECIITKIHFIKKQVRGGQLIWLLVSRQVLILIEWKTLTSIGLVITLVTDIKSTW